MLGSYVLGKFRFLISQRPEVEAKIVAELDAAGLLVTLDRPNPRQFELTDIQSLPFFICVCKACARPLRYCAASLSLKCHQSKMSSDTN